MTVHVDPISADEVTPSSHRWTREDYYRLGDLGFFAPDARVQLINGEIIETISPRKTPHTVTLNTVHALRQAFSADTFLLVEVSDSTLAYDRTRKAALYAAASVPEYWIANVAARNLEVHRTPLGATYQDVSVYDETQTIAPLGAAMSAILVGDLFP